MFLGVSGCSTDFRLEAPIFVRFKLKFAENGLFFQLIFSAAV